MISRWCLGNLFEIDKISCDKKSFSKIIFHVGDINFTLFPLNPLLKLLFFAIVHKYTLWFFPEASQSRKQTALDINLTHPAGFYSRREGSSSSARVLYKTVFYLTENTSAQHLIFFCCRWLCFIFTEGTSIKIKILLEQSDSLEMLEHIVLMGWFSVPVPVSD